jgi:pyruvate dehydrogenase E2 component (dihydrolipoamide acetyltransferase)
MATPILMPRQGQSVESCVLVQWAVKKGDVVKEGDIVAQIETDKATFEVPAPAAGVMLDLFFPEGADIPVLTHIAAIGAAGEDCTSLRPGGVATADSGSPNPPAPAQPHGAPPVVSLASMATTDAVADTAAGVSPRARKAAAASGVNPASLPGSGPGGRVLERDVKAAVSGHLSPAARTASLAGKGFAPAQGSGPGGMVLASDLTPETRHPKPSAKSEVPLKGIRKIVAERMRQSLASTAQLTMTASFDITAMQKLRAAAKERGEKLTINDLLCFALVRTLGAHPDLNAHFLGDRIAQFSDVNLGVAVDTPRGLMVPVVAGANRLSLKELSAAIKQRAESCQKGNINPDLLSGGTFTITNLGALGVETFTPVLNVPEVAILGVGGITIKPVRKDGNITLVDSITLSLTVDHQAVDGAPGARFLKDLCVKLESIETLLKD